MSLRAWPTKLRFSRSAQSLLVEFDDGFSTCLPYKTLRLESPSAEVQGHGSGPKPTAPMVPDDLQIDRAEPVGRYAVRLFFSDGHSSGLFTWPYLYTLGQKRSLSA